MNQLMNFTRVRRFHCLILLISLSSCAAKSSPDSELPGQFRIGSINVIIPASESSSEIESIIESSFADVLASYGPADPNLPIRNITIQMRKPVHRDRAIGSLRKSQIRGRVVFGQAEFYPSLGFSYIEDPMQNWRVNISKNSETFYNRQNTFDRLGTLLALDVVGRVRGANLTRNGRAIRTDPEITRRYNERNAAKRRSQQPQRSRGSTPGRPVDTSITSKTVTTPRRYSGPTPPSPT